MRSMHQRSRPRAEVPTSSLADIAFLLLIFFLVTTVFDEEKGLPLLLPDGEEVVVAPENVLHLTARADGVVEVRVGASPDAVTVAPRDVRRIWRETVLNRPAAIAALHVEPGASYGRMIDVLDALQSAGAERISLQVARR